MANLTKEDLTILEKMCQAEEQFMVQEEGSPEERLDEQDDPELARFSSFPIGMEARVACFKPLPRTRASSTGAVLCTQICDVLSHAGD
jgi:hypothetical protein